jgi:hypothetical protein
VGAGRLLEELVEQLALFGVERAEDVVLRGGQRALRCAQALVAGLGEVHEVAATILERPAPGDEPVGLQLVEQADEVRAVDAQLLGERLLGAAAVVAQDRQRDEMPRAQAERGQRRLGAQPGEPSEVVQQSRGPVGVDGGGRDDPQSSRPGEA